MTVAREFSLQFSRSNSPILIPLTSTSTQIFLQGSKQTPTPNEQLGAVALGDDICVVAGLSLLLPPATTCLGACHKSDNLPGPRLDSFSHKTCFGVV